MSQPNAEEDERESFRAWLRFWIVFIATLAAIQALEYYARLY